MYRVYSGVAEIKWKKQTNITKNTQTKRNYLVKEMSGTLQMMAVMSAAREREREMEQEKRRNRFIQIFIPKIGIKTCK